MLKRTFLIFLCAFLSACSSMTHSTALRNRNFDYSLAPVENMNQNLQTPKDLAAPDFTPHFEIPPGQNEYPPQESAELSDMTPPSYDEDYPIPTLPPSHKK